MNDLNEYIGKSCTYTNIVGTGRLGTIQALELIPLASGDTICLVYIKDDMDSSLNIHNDYVNGIMVNYAEISKSNEIFINSEE